MLRVLQNTIYVYQASHAESEQELQRRLEEVSEELRTSQRNLEKAQQDATTLSGKVLFTFRPCFFKFQWAYLAKVLHLKST